MPLGGSDRWLGEEWDRGLQGRGLLQWEHNPSLSLLPRTDSLPIFTKPPTQLPKLKTRPSSLTPPHCPFSLRPFPKASCSSSVLLPQPPSLLSVRTAAAPLGWLPCLPLTGPSRGCQTVLFNTSQVSSPHYFKAFEGSLSPQRKAFAVCTLSHTPFTLQVCQTIPRTPGPLSVLLLLLRMPFPMFSPLKSSRAQNSARP